MPLREVEKRLGVSKGYLTRLFSGVIYLKFDHITVIAEVIGVDPAEILRLAFPPSEQPASPETLRLRAALGVSLPAPTAPEESPLEKAIEQSVAKALAKMLDHVQR
jgi:transcriptional regulator with XRE-family HTH domain